MNWWSLWDAHFMKQTALLPHPTSSRAQHGVPETRNDGESDHAWQRMEIRYWRLMWVKEVCGALPISEWERRMLLYFKIWYKPEPVTNQSSGNEYGHIYTPFGSGGGNCREGKSSCGLTWQAAKATAGSRLQHGSLQFSTQDMMLSQGWHC